MDRPFVTDLSTAELTAVTMALFVVPGLVGVALVKRRLSARERGMTNDVTGIVISVMAAVYGVVLAFAIVVLYEQFRDAEQTVHVETGALAHLYRSTQELPEPVATEMQRAVSGYIDTVTTDEWAAMSEGRSASAAWRDLSAMYAVLGTHAPASAKKAFHDEAVRALGALVDARRVRLSDARASLPTPFVVLLIGGGYLLLLFTLLFDIKGGGYHVLVVVSVSGLVGSCIALCLALEFPFSGGIAVSDAPFHEGELAPL